MLTEAEKKLNTPRQENARQLALEALDAAEKSENPNLQVETALFLQKIYATRGDMFQALEYAIMAYECSANALEDYKLASGLCLINSYNQLGALDRSSKIAGKLIGSEMLDRDTRCALLHTQGQAAAQAGKYQLAINAWSQLLVIARESTQEKLLIECLENLSTLNTEIENFDKAIEYQDELYYKVLWAGQKERAAACATNMAVLYDKKGDNNAAKYHFKLAFETCSARSSVYPDLLVFKAASCLAQNENDEAMKLVDKAMQLLTRPNDTKIEMKALMIKANLLQRQGDLREAKLCGEAARQTAETLSDTEGHLLALELMISIAITKGDKELQNELNAKLKDLNKSIAENRDKELMAKNNLALSAEKSERAVQNYLALVRERNLQTKKEELYEANTRKDMSIMQIEKELHQADLEKMTVSRQRAQQELALAQGQLREQQQLSAIMQLEQDKSSQLLSLAQLEIEKKEQDTYVQIINKQNEVLHAETLLKEEQSKRDKLIRFASVFIGIALLLGLFFSIRAFLRSRRKNSIIKMQSKSIQQSNQTLKEKNQDILNSINYASFFQSTIIPHEKELKKYFSDSFIHYKPLDIVSGDLPFYYEKDGVIYFGAIDCIGHGVPAAMLSFMVHYNLIEIINHNLHAEPGVLLSMLNKTILETLQKETHRNFNAGADVSLCRHVCGTGKISFSGAQSPLIMQRGKDITRIKSDPYSLGDTVLNQMTEFTTHVFELNKKDRIYLMSDGLIHQHGGVNQRQKFGTKKLIEQLVQFSFKSMRDLKSGISEIHNSWKGNTEQTDDIMLIGIEI